MAHATEEVKAAATEHLRADVTTGGGIAEAAERAGLLQRTASGLRRPRVQVPARAA